MGRSHVEIAIDADPSQFDLLIGIMASEGFERFWEEKAALRAYVPEEVFSDDLLIRLRERLAIVLPGGAPLSIKVRRIREQNWNRSWERTIRPIHATERIVIAPSWHPYRARAGEIVLTIDPKMSFGTGYHETTRLVLHFIEKSVPTGAHLLDVGTGTGVLAIAAIKLGAATAIGIDSDEWAYANAKENAALNGVSERLDVRLGDLSVVPERGFDCIVANIQKTVIEEMLPGLCARLGEGGQLMLSGLLCTEGSAMHEKLTSFGLAVVDDRSEGEWIALAAVWPPGRRVQKDQAV